MVQDCGGIKTVEALVDRPPPLILLLTSLSLKNQFLLWFMIFPNRKEIQSRTVTVYQRRRAHDPHRCWVLGHSGSTVGIPGEISETELWTWTSPSVRSRSVKWQIHERQLEHSSKLDYNTRAQLLHRKGVMTLLDYSLYAAQLWYSSVHDMSECKSGERRF